MGGPIAARGDAGEAPGGALPLIVDADDTVLEASRANLFAVRDGALFTPPLDGRILPGITRMRGVEIAGDLGMELEDRLSPGDLLGADEVSSPVPCAASSRSMRDSTATGLRRRRRDRRSRLAAELRRDLGSARTRLDRVPRR